MRYSVIVSVQSHYTTHWTKRSSYNKRWRGSSVSYVTISWRRFKSCFHKNFIWFTLDRKHLVKTLLNDNKSIRLSLPLRRVILAFVDIILDKVYWYSTASAFQFVHFHIWKSFSVEASNISISHRHCLVFLLQLLRYLTHWTCSLSVNINSCCAISWLYPTQYWLLWTVL